MPPVSYKNVSIRISPFLARLARSFFAQKLRNPVFVLGCGRSGTTLAVRLLSMHADVAEWSEANAIWDPGWYPWRDSLVGKPPMEVDPDAFNQRWWKETEPRVEQIRATFGVFQWLSGRTHFANKSPFHTFRLRQLAVLFPKAKFIHVLRDGRAVAFSYALHLERKGKLREWPLELRQKYESSTDELVLRLALFWQRSVHEVEARASEPELTNRLLLLRYEDICLDPRGSLAQVSDWVGLDTRQFGPKLQTLKLESRNDKWRRLSRNTVAKLEESLGDDLLRFGYEA